MLFKTAILDKIGTGDVRLAFRRWKRPSVSAGGSLRTAVGILAIDSVETIEPGDITQEEAIGAGFATLAKLLSSLGTNPALKLYKIGFHVAGPDPRKALVLRDQLAEEEQAHLCRRLAEFDATSATGPWTWQVLERIASREGMTAADISADLGLDKAALKIKIRKLKELGLTESLQSGYRLSPRGWALRRGSDKT